MRSVWRAFAACFSLVCAAWCLTFLSGSAAALRLAARTPLSAQPRCMRARASRPALVSAYSP